MLGSRSKNSLFYKTYFIVTQRDNRENFKTQKCSAVDVGLKRLLFDNCCIAPNTLILITALSLLQICYEIKS